MIAVGAAVVPEVTEDVILASECHVPVFLLKMSNGIDTNPPGTGDPSTGRYSVLSAGADGRPAHHVQVAATRDRRQAPRPAGGKVAPTHAGKRLKFVFQRLSGGRWHSVASQQLPIRRGGAVRDSFTAHAAGSYRRKAFFAGDAASASGWLRFGVR